MRKYKIIIAILLIAALAGWTYSGYIAVQIYKKEKSK